MSKTKIEFIRIEGKNSYAIRVKPAKASKAEFTIPVIDVRDGKAEREKGAQMTKGKRGSKYFS